MAKKKGTNSPELAEYKAKQEASVNAALLRFTLLLKAAGVSSVTVEYAGYGDSGQIDGFTFANKKGKDVPNPFPERSEVASDWSDLWYDVLDKRGWNVNNEGSQGRIDWNVDKDLLEMTLEHNITTVETYEFAGLDVLDGVDTERGDV